MFKLACTCTRISIVDRENNYGWRRSIDIPSKIKVKRTLARDYALSWWWLGTRFTRLAIKVFEAGPNNESVCLG